MHITKSQTIGITGREKGLQDDWMAHQEVKCEVCWRWSLQRLPCFFGHLHASSKFPNVKWKRYTASQKTLSLSYRAAWLQNMIGRNRPIDYNLHGSWPQKNCTTVQNFQCVDPSRHCLDLLHHCIKSNIGRQNLSQKLHSQIYWNQGKRTWGRKNLRVCT
jgi:hypothetical protein